MSLRQRRRPQSQSASAVSGRRVPRGEDSGVSCVLSKQHERKFSGETRQACSRLVQGYLAFSQPAFGAVLLLSEFPRQLQNFFVDFLVAAIRRQTLRESFGQTVPNIDPLDAALLQQTAPRSPLSGSCDFAALDHHVRMHRGCETIVAGIA